MDFEEKATDELSIPGLAKLLMYGNFVHARAAAEKRSIKEVVEEELDLYPYSKKKIFKEPYFPPVHINIENTEHTNFKPALTDAGICKVYNGDNLFSTFTSSARTNDLQYSLDPREESIKPHNITGTGKISQISMWLDASNKYTDNVKFFDKREGSLMLAINSWQTYYDVRINQLDLRAGTDVIIKVEPVVHSASADFKALKLEDRNCRFLDEQEVKT